MTERRRVLLEATAEVVVTCLFWSFILIICAPLTLMVGFLSRGRAGQLLQGLLDTSRSCISSAVTDGLALWRDTPSTSDMQEYLESVQQERRVSPENLVRSRTGVKLYHAGYVDSIRHKDGTGSAFYDTTFAYTSATKIVGDVTVVRMFVNSRWVYTEETTDKAGDGTDPSGAYETTYTYSFYDGVGDSSPLMVEELLTTNPIVTTANNGSGIALKSRDYFDEAGRRTFEKTTEGITNHYLYRAEDGRLERVILDADTESTDITDDIPFNFNSTGSPLHRTNCYSYKGGEGSGFTCQCPCEMQAQGNAQRFGDDGTTMVSYTARLADGRFVTLTFPHYRNPPSGSDQYYGPVTYTVHNHAGKNDLEGVIALDDVYTTADPADFVDETDDDPIAAIEHGPSAIGDVAQMTTYLYSETGQRLEKSRLYSDMLTLAYDETLYGYDDMGRMDRIKDPTGTISRTVYDALGRVTEEWLGTDDYGFEGSDTSGDDNMVQTAAMEYDGGPSEDAGNGYLTSETLYLEGGATPAERETTFSHDVRGNVLRQANAEAPDFVLNKYDNLGRLIARGLYTTSVGAGEDPTSHATNRLSLTQASFDQLGRVYETKRHRIDQGDGSDLNNLETNVWYGLNGRVIKVQGEELTKTFYDRLGRQTHEFILAGHNDGTSNYNAADDVDGDHVLQERQTVYAGDISAAIELLTFNMDRDTRPSDTQIRRRRTPLFKELNVLNAGRATVRVPDDELEPDLIECVVARL